MGECANLTDLRHLDREYTASVSEYSNMLDQLDRLDQSAELANFSDPTTGRQVGEVGP